MRLNRPQLATTKVARCDRRMGSPAAFPRAFEFGKNLISPQAANDTGSFASPPLKRSAVSP